MSRFEVHSVHCPRCGHAQDEKIYVSVNGDRIRTAADDIIAAEFGHVHCEACGRDYYTDSTLLYTEFSRQLWILQYRLADLPRYRECEIEAAAVFEREYFERSPPAVAAQARQANVRVCFGRPQLAEKLLARRHEIDDRALECLKLVITRDHMADLLKYGPTELVLADCNASHLKLLAIAADERKPVHEFQIDRRDLHDVEAGLDDFRQPFPDLFDKLYVNAARYLT